MSILRMTSAAAFAAVVALSGASAHDVQPGSEFTVVERAQSDAVTDTGAEGDSPGDLLTFSNPLFDAANAEKVGQANGVCVRTVPGTSWECAWTNQLADGQVNVAGTFHDAGDSLFTVTGGTGRYLGATGQMRLRSRDAEGSAFDFTFSLAN